MECKLETFFVSLFNPKRVQQFSWVDDVHFILRGKGIMIIQGTYLHHL